MNAYEDLATLGVAPPVGLEDAFGTHVAPIDFPHLHDIDLGPYLDGSVVRIFPTILTPRDGTPLFYRGQLNSIHGDSGSGKTFIALMAVAEELADGRHVTWLHLEDPSPLPIIERLREQFGVGVETIREFFHYKQIGEPLTGRQAQWLAELLHDPGQLVIVDSLGEAFSLSGINENNDVEVGPWFRQVPRTLVDAGATVLLIDHSTKAGDNALYASGSKRKRAAITGASFLVEAVVALTKAAGGRVKLTVAKDRHGHHKAKTVAAVFVMKVVLGESTVELVTGVDEPSADRDRRASFVDDILTVTRIARIAGHEMTQRTFVAMCRGDAQVNEAGGMGDGRVKSAIDGAVQKGVVRETAGNNRARLFRFVEDPKGPIK